MPRIKQEVAVRVFDDPNFRRYKDTQYYLSRMGTIKKRCRFKDVDISGYMKNAKWVFYCKGKAVILARAIYETFYGEVGNDYRIVHIDGCKTNNALHNLKKVSISEAASHYHKGKGYKQVLDLKTNITYRSRIECGKALGYTPEVIGKICNGTYKRKTGLKLIYVKE